MNAKQRRNKRRIKYFSLVEQLNGELYCTDMKIDKNDWVIVEFVSDIKKQAYYIKIGTCLANLNYEIYEMAFDSVDSIKELHWLGIGKKESEEIRVKSKELKADPLRYPKVFEYLEFRETEKIATASILLECNIFLPYIDEINVENVIELFKFNNEKTYRDKNPLPPEYFFKDLNKGLLIEKTGIEYSKVN